MAAWPASQPLFDSLRHGITELESKTKELKNARDTIKNVHIAIDRSAWREACGSILVHWKSTLETHRSIFKEVAKATKPLPGAEPDVIFNSFDLLMGMTRGIIAAVDGMKNSIDLKRDIQTSTFSENSDMHSESEQSELPDASEVGHSASKTRKHEHGRETVSLPHRSPEMPKETGVKSASEKIDQHATGSPIDPTKIAIDIGGGILNPFYTGLVDHVPRVKSKITKTALTSAQASHAKAGMARPLFPAQTERKSSTEDITNLVDALLEAKKAKREEKKDRKKRKRDSIASSIFSPAQSEHGDSFTRNDSETAKTSSRTDLPPKKKIKLWAGTEGDGGEVKTSRARDHAAKKEAIKKAAKKLKKRKADHRNLARNKIDFVSSTVDDNRDTNPKHQKEADDKGGDSKGKKEQKSKRRRSSDCLDNEPQDQTSNHGRDHDHGKKAKRIRTG